MAFGVKCLQYLAPSGDPEGWRFIYPSIAIFSVELLNKNILLCGVVSDGSHWSQYDFHNWCQWEADCVDCDCVTLVKDEHCALLSNISHPYFKDITCKKYPGKEGKRYVLVITKLTFWILFLAGRENIKCKACALLIFIWTVFWYIAFLMLRGILLHYFPAWWLMSCSENDPLKFYQFCVLVRQYEEMPLEN